MPKDNLDEVIGERLATKGIETYSFSQEKPAYFVLITVFALLQFNRIFLKDTLNIHYNQSVFIFWFIIVCLIIYTFFSIYKIIKKIDFNKPFKIIYGINLAILIYFNIMAYIITTVEIIDRYAISYLDRYTHVTDISILIMVIILSIFYKPIKKLFQIVIRFIKRYL